MTSLSKARLTVYASSAEKLVCFPPRTKSFPLAPRATVTRRPNNMKVKTSPYYDHRYNVSYFVITSNETHLLPTSKEEVDWIVPILDSRTDDRQPMENDWWGRTTGRYLTSA